MLGNMSKKWNKHNFFLFTAAGLLRYFVHQESSIYFLSISNLAPPLEMLDCESAVVYAACLTAISNTHI